LRLFEKSLPYPGQIIPEVSFMLESGCSLNYCVEPACGTRMISNRMPVSPTVLAGICMAKLSRLGNIPAGTIHTHAFLTHSGNVFPGETVYFSGRIGTFITRGNVVLLAMVFKILNFKRQPVVHGRINLLLPSGQM